MTSQTTGGNLKAQLAHLVALTMSGSIPATINLAVTSVMLNVIVADMLKSATMFICNTKSKKVASMKNLNTKTLTPDLVLTDCSCSNSPSASVLVAEPA